MSSSSSDDNESPPPVRKETIDGDFAAAAAVPRTAPSSSDGGGVIVGGIPNSIVSGSVGSSSTLPLTPEERLLKQEEESFYSAHDNKHGDDNIWGLLSGVGGNIYEWYDFAVYGLLASEIGEAFFPQSSKELQLINSFGVYLAAFLMRPLGAIVFGELGDRIAGRKNALVMSIILITVPSVTMGLLPTYETWGTAAPVCLVILRMFQGLSVGGQLAGSYVISIEQSTSSNRGFRGSVCDASSVGGFLLASGVTTVVRHIFTEDAVNRWAWRTPFWFSLVLAPILYKIVKRSEESKFWSERNDQKEAENIIRENEQKQQTPAVVDLFSSPFNRRQLVGMVGVMSSSTSSFYMIFMWSPVYLSHLRGIMSEAKADLMSFFVVAIYITCLLFCGKLSDAFPHRMDLMRIGVTGVIVAAPVMFGMFESESYLGYFLGQVQYALCLAILHGGMAAWEVELWMADPTLSFTGVAIGHNIAATLFGGTMPLMATFLFYRSDGLASRLAGGDLDAWEALYPRLIPGLYVSVLGCVTLYCLGNVIRHPHDVRTGEKKLREVYHKETRRRKRKEKKKREGRRMAGGGGGTKGAKKSAGFLIKDAETGNAGAYVPPST